ncbi:MAG: TIGR00297 family protein [Archaeoglobus sp.]|nr:TIGR00297 family protein [Archaeoglobus sp.]
MGYQFKKFEGVFFPKGVFLSLAVLPSLLIPFFEAWIVLGILAPLILLFTIYEGEEIRIGVSSLNSQSSFFNSYLISIILVLSTFTGVPVYIAGVTIFMLIGHEFRKNPVFDIGIFTILAFAYLNFFSLIKGSVFDEEFLFFLSLMGGITAALVESIEVESDKRTTLLLATSSVLLIFNIYGIYAPFNHLIYAFIISFVLGLVAMRAGVADESGLMSATLIGTLIIVFTDIRFFLILASFYIIGSFATKYRYSVKLNLGIEEPAGGARGYANVFSNSLPALFFALNYYVLSSDLFLVAFVASIATALGDTLASEIGKTSGKVYLITNFKPVSPGESGGVSLLGELSAFLGAAIVTLFAFMLSVIPAEYVPVAIIAGFIGVHVDSFLGATLERLGYLTNSGVNFFATLSTIVVCYFLML